MPRQTLKQRADGRYACKWQGQTFYGKTQKEALAARDAAKARAGEGLAQSVPFLADYAARWLPSAKGHCERRSYNQQARYLNKLCSFIGPRRIDRVTPSDIRDFLAREYSGVTTNTLTRVRSVYSALF